MALPYLFTNVTAATGAMLDSDFAALGSYAVIPCTSSGTSAITLTPVTNTPTITAYSQDQIYLAVMSSAPTATVDAQVGSLTSLPVYQDTPSGPVAAGAASWASGNLVGFAYDSSLNNGAGGFHLISGYSVSVAPVIGSNSRLIGYATVATAIATWTANELVAEATLGGAAVKGSGLTLTFTGTGTGAGGMDTGSMPTSAGLAVYAIYNPTTATWNTLGYAYGTTAPTQVYPGSNMPSGYTFSTLLWTGVTNSSAKFYNFYQTDRQVRVGPVSVLSAAAAATNTYYSLSLSTVVPLSATTAWGFAGGTSTSAAVQLAIASDSSGRYVQYAIYTESSVVLDTFSGGVAWEAVPLTTAQTVYWKAGTTTQVNVIQIEGYTF